MTPTQNRCFLFTLWRKGIHYWRQGYECQCVSGKKACALRVWGSESRSFSLWDGIWGSRKLASELRWLYGISRPSRMGYKKCHENSRKFSVMSKSVINLAEPSVATRPWGGEEYSMQEQSTQHWLLEPRWDGCLRGGQCGLITNGNQVPSPANTMALYMPHEFYATLGTGWENP